MQYASRDEKMTFLSIYTVVFGPFWTAQEIHKRGVVEDNFKAVIAILYFKKGVERAEVDAGVLTFQTKHKLKNLEGVIIIVMDQNIVQT